MTSTVINAILNNPQESRNELMLNLFEDYGKRNQGNSRYQLRQHENHPILLNSVDKTKQRTNYLQENPVRTGFVSYSEYWLYSCAIDYFMINEKGMLDLDILQ